jgi:Family of unknown function (DUF6416)
MRLEDDDPAWERHSGRDLHQGPEWQAEDIARAETFYSSISRNAALVLDALMDHPGQRVSVDELAQQVRPRKPRGTPTNHRRAVAASLTSVHGPAQESGRRLPFYWWAGAGGSPARYAMKPAVAQLLREARHQAGLRPRAGRAVTRAGNGPAAGPYDWTSTEISDTVADYLSMPAEEASRKPYSKAEHRRVLSNRLNGARSEGAIEFKHQNISAVMDELGLPHIEG